MIKTVQRLGHLQLKAPVSLSAAFATNHISMRNCKFLEIDIRIGVANTDLMRVLLRQATNVEGAGDKAMIMTTGQVYSNLGNANYVGGTVSDAWAEVTVVNSGVNTGYFLLVAQTNFKIFVRNDELDAQNDFDALGLDVTTVSGNHLVSIDVTAHDTRFSGQVGDRARVPSLCINSEATLGGVGL